MNESEFKEVSQDFNNLFHKILESSSNDRQDHFANIKKIYYNYKINSYYFKYTGDKSDEYKYIPLEIDEETNRINWMMKNKGWNVYIPIPTSYYNYTLDVIKNITFTTFKETYNIKHGSIVKMFNDQKNYNLWLWTDSEDKPDVNKIYDTLYKLITQQTVEDDKVFVEYFTKLYNAVGNTEPVIKDDKYTYNVKLYDTDLEEMREIVKNNTEYANMRFDIILEEFGNIYQNTLTTLIKSLIYQHFPTLNLK